jgi:hypothetical protein
MRDPICSAFSLIDFTVKFFAQLQVAVIGNQTGKRIRRRHNVVRMLIEHGKKIGVAG